jgi:hypothetical protein
MKFNSSNNQEAHRVPNYLSGKDRRRVSIWVLAIGFVFLIVTQGETFLRASRAYMGKRYAPEVDTRIANPHERQRLPFDAVVIAPAVEDGIVLAQTTTDTDSTTTTDEAPPAPAAKTNESKLAEEIPSEKPRSATVTEPVKQPAKPRFFTGVDEELLKALKDKDILRGRELPTWFHLQQIIFAATPESLKQAAIKVTEFREMHIQPDYYRGKIVQLQGCVMWYVAEPEAAANPLGLKQLYQVGFRLTGDDNPIFVYCRDLPANMPAGKKSADSERIEYKNKEFPATVEALFVKQMAYTAQDTYRYAPTLLATSVTYIPAPPAEPPPIYTNFYFLISFVVIGMLTMTALIWTLNRPKTKFTITGPQVEPSLDKIELSEPTPPNSDPLSQQST